MPFPRMPRWLAYWWLLAVVWGSSFVLIKFGLEAFSPLQVAGGRVLFGLLAVVTVLVVQGGRLPRSWAIWGHVTFISLMLNVLPFTLFAWAETRVSSVLAGLFNATTPLFTALFALAIVPSDKLTRQTVIGLFTGFVGVMTVMGVWRGVTGDFAGSLACIGATLCYGIGVPWTRRFLSHRDEGAASLMAAQLICATAILAVLCLLFTSPPQFTLRATVATAVLGVFATGLAFIWMFRVIREAGSVVSAAVTYATPLVSTVLGIAVLGESLSWNQPVGAAVVLVGAALVQGLIGQRSPTPQPSVD